jgi:hypothetical protein
MPISYLRSERGSTSSSPWVSLYEWTMVRETTVKENNNGGWNFDSVVLWLGMRQNKDAVE